jgi:hypothetical protein
MKRVVTPFIIQVIFFACHSFLPKEVQAQTATANPSACSNSGKFAEEESVFRNEANGSIIVEQAFNGYSIEGGRIVATGTSGVISSFTVELYGETGRVVMKISKRSKENKWIVHGEQFYTEPQTKLSQRASNLSFSICAEHLDFKQSITSDSDRSFAILMLDVYAAAVRSLVRQGYRFL